MVGKVEKSKCVSVCVRMSQKEIQVKYLTLQLFALPVEMTGDSIMKYGCCRQRNNVTLRNFSYPSIVQEMCNGLVIGMLCSCLFPPSSLHSFSGWQLEKCNCELYIPFLLYDIK